MKQISRRQPRNKGHLLGIFAIELVVFLRLGILGMGKSNPDVIFYRIL